MRKLRALIAGMFLWLFVFPQWAAAIEDIMIDVENGSLKTGSYSILLDKSKEKPISVGFEDGNIILIVLTEAGSVIRLNLGQGRVALSKRANPYVRIEQTSSAIESLSGNQTNQSNSDENCIICGKSLSLGNHSRYPCGHYVCVVGVDHEGGICPTCQGPLCDGQDHAVCPKCGRGFCGHDDADCEDPPAAASTPYIMTGPSGETLYFHLSPDGSFMLGTHSEEAPEEWSPAYENLRDLWPAMASAPT